MKRDRETNVPSGNTKYILSRRDLVKRGAWALAATAIPGGVNLAAQEISPMMQKLSTYMSEARNNALPDKVQEETTDHILDTFAAVISGSVPPPGRMVRR